MKPGSKGGASVSPRDLREHITGRGDLREHLSGRRDHGGSRGKEHESYRYKSYALITGNINTRDTCIT